MNKKFTKEPIQIGPKLKQKLIKEFGCTRQTVYIALIYKNNSPLARSIRKRSKEMLIEEAEKIKIWDGRPTNFSRDIKSNLT